MPDSSVIPCCISPYDESYGNGKEQTALEIWNSKKFKSLRLKMLSGEAIPGCSRCSHLENSGFKSMRNEMNQFFHSYLDLTKETKEDGSIEKLQLRYIDIRFSNLCNFKCRGCGPTLSSAWFDDYKALYPEEFLGKRVNSISVESPHFWSELKLLIPHADVIYFGGGEPLITKEHFEILSYLNELGLNDIELRYTTNLSQLNYGNYDLTKIWSQFKKINLSVSIDDIGSRAEYFRNGTKWSQIEKNFEILKNKYPEINRSVNCTVNIMNVYYLIEIYEYLVLKNYIKPEHFNINLLLDPHELRIDALPIHLKKLVTIRLTKFKFKLSCLSPEHQSNIKDIDNIIHFMNLSDKTFSKEEFILKTGQLDILRNENFLSVYPELKDLMTI